MKNILDTFRQGHHEFENSRLEGFEGVNPYELFELWTTEAVENKENEPNAFVLATVSSNGQSSSRIVYLKDIIEKRFVFYTNYSSQKGVDIESNPKVSMLFFWPNAARQVRIEGKCSKVPTEVSDAYFASRPRGSQIGAWASNQSDSLSSREELEARFEDFEKKFPNEIPRPDHWGGFWIDPSSFEFWQGRPSRLHDRIRFEEADGVWKNRRLNP